MTHDDDHHDHDDHDTTTTITTIRSRAGTRSRAEALESLLVERGLDPTRGHRRDRRPLRAGHRAPERDQARRTRLGRPGVSGAPDRRPLGRGRGARPRDRPRPRADRRPREQPPPSTTSSSARSARATRRRCSACRPPGTRARPTARASSASRASCCARWDSTSPPTSR